MQKIFTFLFAALMSVGMFGKTVTEDIPLNAETWGWGYNCSVNFNNGIMECTLTGEWGAATGWNEPIRDISEWDRIVIVVENMNGCDGQWFKLKAYLRDYVNKDSEQGQMEAALGWDAEDNQPHYMVINLKEEGKNVNLTACGVLGIQCQPNGAVFKISRVYLEKEVEAETEYYLVGSINEWNAVDLTEDLKLAANPTADGEYMINYDFAAGDQFKVVGRQAGQESVTWFPDGMDNNYQITKAGNYNVYFRPDGQGGEGWHYGYIYAERQINLENVIVGINVPAAGKPESIEIVGTFGDGWDNGVLMEQNQETGWYVVYDLQAQATDEFKFRGAGSWENELYVRNAETGMWEVLPNLVFGEVWQDDTWKGNPVKMIEIDFSDAAWKATNPEGIENIVLTEKAKKVVMDGMVYIVRDGKLFNLTGAQIR